MNLGSVFSREYCKKVLGFILVLFPISVFLVMHALHYDYFWRFSEGAKSVDLVHTIINFVIILIGYKLLATKLDCTLLIFFLTCFIVYQIFGWHWQSSAKQYIQLTPVTETKHVALEDISGGAFTSSSFVNVNVYKKTLFGLFYEKFRVASIQKVRTYQIADVSEELVIIEWQTFAGEQGESKVKIDELSLHH